MKPLPSSSLVYGQDVPQLRRGWIGSTMNLVLPCTSTAHYSIMVPDSMGGLSSVHEITSYGQNLKI